MTDAQPVQAPPVQPTPQRKVGFLLGLGIFIMPYIFGWLTLRKGHTSTAKIVSFAWMGLMLIVYATSDKKAPPPTATGPSQAMAAADPQPAKQEQRQEQAPAEEVRWISDSCADVAKQWGLGSKLTELQKDDLWKRGQVEGMHFKWKLKVMSVDSTFGKLQAQLKCQNSKAFVSDMILGVEDKDLALKLVKDETYTVHGVLSDWGNLIGLQGSLIEVLAE